jgi:hypothetical protein
MGLGHLLGIEVGEGMGRSFGTDHPLRRSALPAGGSSPRATAEDTALTAAAQRVHSKKRLREKGSSREVLFASSLMFTSASSKGSPLPVYAKRRPRVDVG